MKPFLNFLGVSKGLRVEDIIAGETTHAPREYLADRLRLDLFFKLEESILGLTWSSIFLVAGDSR